MGGLRADPGVAARHTAARGGADPFTSAELLERASGWYAGNTERTAPLVSPLFAELHGLPPLVLHVGSDEILLSDSQRVAEKVRGQGGRAELRVWDGMWHVWPMYPELPEAAQALAELRRFVDEVAHDGRSSPTRSISGNRE